MSVGNSVGNNSSRTKGNKQFLQVVKGMEIGNRKKSWLSSSANILSMWLARNCWIFTCIWYLLHNVGTKLQRSFKIVYSKMLKKWENVVGVGLNYNYKKLLDYHNY
jgi:hypothetical protein